MLKTTTTKKMVVNSLTLPNTNWDMRLDLIIIVQLPLLWNLRVEKQVSNLLILTMLRSSMVRLFKVSNHYYHLQAEPEGSAFLIK